MSKGFPDSTTDAGGKFRVLLSKTYQMDSQILLQVKVEEALELLQEHRMIVKMDHILVVFVVLVVCSGIDHIEFQAAVFEVKSQ